MGRHRSLLNSSSSLEGGITILAKDRSISINEETTRKLARNHSIQNSHILAHPFLSPDECGVYLAPSTIPNAGYGIFTTGKKLEGDTIGSGDICIPIMESYLSHQINNKDSNDDDELPFLSSYFQHYVWNADQMGIHHLVASDDVQAFCPGLDAAVNCNIALMSIDKSTTVYEDGNLHRTKHHAAGAQSPYHNGATDVTRDIPEGGELFKFYGDTW